MQSEVKAVRPKALPLKRDQIPHELRKRPQWVCWNYTLEGGKWTKPPVRPDGGHVDSTDASTWSTFEKCWVAYDRNECTGLGFVTASTDPYVLIDLDHVRNADGTTKAWAQAILDAAHQERAYIEWSVSGEGYHIIGRGKQGFAGRKRNDAELYCQGRYFTITGHVPPGMKCDIIGQLDTTITMVQARIGHDGGDNNDGAPIVGKRTYPDNMTDDEILKLTSTFENGERLEKLLAGDTSDYLSKSEADIACANFLGFIFWNDPDKVAQVMRASDLARDKWKTHKSYLMGTINKALHGKKDYYMYVSKTPVKGPVIVWRTALDIVQHPVPARWLLKPYLEHDVTAVMSGDYGTYKSFLCLDWSMHLAMGMPWYNDPRGAIEAEHALYISAEGRGLNNRVRAWVKHHFPTDPRDSILKRAKFHALEMAINLSDPERMKALLASIDKLNVKPVLVVIDTLTKNSNNVEESNPSMQAFLNVLNDELRMRYRCAVLLVHHVGHGDQDRPRGPRSLISNTDSAFMVTHIGGTVTLRTERLKDSEAPPAIALKPNIVDLDSSDTDGQPESSAVLVRGEIVRVIPTAPNPRALWQQLNTTFKAKHTRKELTEIAKAAGLDRKRGPEARDTLLKAGWLVERNDIYEFKK
jgi:putative DNA primase/helicase